MVVRLAVGSAAFSSRRGLAKIFGVEPTDVCLADARGVPDPSLPVAVALSPVLKEAGPPTPFVNLDLDFCFKPSGWGHAHGVTPRDVDRFDP